MGCDVEPVATATAFRRPDDRQKKERAETHGWAGLAETHRRIQDNMYPWGIHRWAQCSRNSHVLGSGVDGMCQLSSKHAGMCHAPSRTSATTVVLFLHILCLFILVTGCLQSTAVDVVQVCHVSASWCKVLASWFPANPIQAREREPCMFVNGACTWPTGLSMFRFTSADDRPYRFNSKAFFPRHRPHERITQRTSLTLEVVWLVCIAVSG